ncbi:ATP-binding cassette domain-containing protein [Amycolatopsis sp. NPDC023774]|uniref:ATP-binding cassette domain-containing protein n=1 Tax=Amycolatopsis sp. NPDC023774 TaxID=3155015 RepID=UPI0033D8ED46
MSEATGSTRTFGSVGALSSVSLSAARGTFLGLLAHNGAGKTTLVNILTTMLPARSASARRRVLTSRAKEVRSAHRPGRLGGPGAHGSREFFRFSPVGNPTSLSVSRKPHTTQGDPGPGSPRAGRSGTG